MSLPAGFETLEPFVAQWAVDGTAARDALRGSSSAKERQSFYDAAQPLLASALDYLDAKPLGSFDAGDAALMNMMLSFAHVSIAVEIQREDEPRHAVARAHMRIMTSVADQ